MSSPPAVALSSIRKRFGANEVLKGVSLEARDGDVIAIIGSSGSGKSTLLRCINMLEVPDEGEVAVAGEAIRLKPARGGGREPADRRQLDRIRTSLGMVFQSFNLWSHLTVLENVIEAPVHVQGRSRDEAIAEGGRFSPRLASPTRKAPIRRRSPEASSSAPPSRGRSPCGRR